MSPTTATFKTEGGKVELASRPTILSSQPKAHSISVKPELTLITRLTGTVKSDISPSTITTVIVVGTETGVGVGIGVNVGLIVGEGVKGNTGVEVPVGLVEGDGVDGDEVVVGIGVESEDITEADGEFVGCV